MKGQKVPGTVQKVPGTTDSARSKKVPGTVQKVPGTVQKVPGTVQKVPGTTDSALSKKVPGTVQDAWQHVGRLLIDAMDDAGHWRGELSASALSTATATFAIHCVLEQRPELATDVWRQRIQRGADWLVRHVNADGGWGDTVRSASHPSTTTLCWAVLSAVGEAQDQSTLDDAAHWLTGRFGSLDPEGLGRGIEGIYGEDRTFSAPILAMCSLAGVLGDPSHALARVPGLPFELAALPQSWFGFVGLPVVSYALPALIAVGQVQHHHAPSRNPLLRGLRQRLRALTLRRLDALQPSSGGFLEAIPLTSFVTMCLAGSGQASHSVVDRSLKFLDRSQADDGSWPIDIDLATWVTTLSIQGLSLGDEGPRGLDPPTVDVLRSWLLDQQYQTVHPFTGAAPGGWAWTDLPGGVPDADDTPGALLALRHLRHDGANDARCVAAAEAGLQWLVDLQNRDGGMPTFCRGWGKLPFDRSSPDLTAHALRAFAAWQDEVSPGLGKRLDRARRKALRFLRREQRPDGSWAPLWFGNENVPSLENFTYGTAKVLRALDDSGTSTAVDLGMEDEANRAESWLLAAQNSDGGWGGATGVASTMEESALAVDALAGRRDDAVDQALACGAGFLIRCLDSEAYKSPAPIGFYFANLWYFEKLYPLSFTAAALGRMLQRAEGERTARK